MIEKIKQLLAKLFHTTTAETATDAAEVVPERNFWEIVNRIMNVCENPDLCKVLDSNAPFWAPEIRWKNLSDYVNTFVQPDSSNPVSVRVYAVLCDKTEDEMREQFIENGR